MFCVTAESDAHTNSVYNTKQNEYDSMHVDLLSLNNKLVVTAKADPHPCFHLCKNQALQCRDSYVKVNIIQCQNLHSNIFINKNLILSANLPIVRDICICMYGDNPALGFYANKLFDLI